MESLQSEDDLESISRPSDSEYWSDPESVDGLLYGTHIPAPPLPTRGSSYSHVVLPLDYVRYTPVDANFLHFSHPGLSNLLNHNSSAERRLVPVRDPYSDWQQRQREHHDELRDYHRSSIRTRNEPHERPNPPPNSQQANSNQLPTTPSQRSVDIIFQRHLDILRANPADDTIHIRTSTVLSALRKSCNTLDRLPSVLYLRGVIFHNNNGRPQPVAGGSFSDVYRARWQNIEVAVKVLRTHQISDDKKRKKLRKSFINEALLWASCGHKYVLQFLGVDTNNKDFSHGMCMVLPWMKHGNVHTALKLLRQRNLNRGIQGQVDIWIYQIARGLAYLQSLGIIHGDLRAANVLVDEHYNIKLSDFGLSLIVDDITQATTIERTPNWIAPEFLDPEKFGKTSSKPTLVGDVYAFGCVTIELYTGKPPYPDLPSYQVITKVMKGEAILRPRFYDEPHSMDHSMWSVIEQCLSREPSSRPSALEIPEMLTRN